MNPPNSHRLIGAAVVALFASHALTQAKATEALVFHDLAAMAPVTRGTAATLKPVITSSGSLMTAVLSGEYRQAPHHHDQEQITMGIDGAFQLTIGSSRHSMKALMVGLPPANVPHFMTNDSGTSATILEYQPVPRRDWAPPFPSPPYNAGPGVVVPPTEPIFADLSPAAARWVADETGARTIGFAGRTIAVRMWDLSEPAASVDLTTGQARVQRFVYVFDGRITIIAGSLQRDIGREMCVEITPPLEHVIARSLGKESIIAVFERLAR
jgi:quercetin dioxygenase-like cupin family protein